MCLIRHSLVLLVCGVVLLGSSGCGARRLRTSNRDTAYGRWNRTSIPYYIDPAFTAAEQAMIRAAISAVQSSVNYCVAFTEVPATALQFKIKFTPLTGAAGSAPQRYCFSYPGVNLALQKVSLEQIVSLARGPTGCMASSCTIQKYIAILLGKRNEHQRGDRGNFITVNTANLALPAAYQNYAATEALWSLFPYDYCSITHNQPTDFAIAGTQAFSIPSTAIVTSIPQLCQLSLTDCKLISMMYSCDISACTQPTCATQALSAASTTTVSTTTVSSTTSSTTAASTTTTVSTTTPPPCAIDFCTATIDEGAWLLDGRQVIFSGTCYAEIDPIQLKVKIGTTKYISTLFPGVTGPVQAVWRSDTATQHVLLKTGVQYACTTTACTVETAKPIAGTQAVFELDDGSGVYPIYTIQTGGTTYSNDLTPGSTVPVANVVDGSGTGPFTSWTSAWATGTVNTVNVIGMVGGVQQIAQMTYLFFDIFSTTTPVPFCPAV